MRVNAQRTPRERERDLLNDPIAFVHEAWDGLIGSGPLGDLFMSSQPRSMWNNRNEAFRLVRVAAETRGADLDHYLDMAEEASTTLAIHQYHLGLELGAVLEQLRQGLLACLASMEAPHANDADEAKRLAKMRAQLEAGRAPANEAA